MATFIYILVALILLSSGGEGAKSQDNDADLSHLSDNVLCPVCQWAMTELKSLIVGPVTKDAVKAALNVLCDDAPFTLKPVCIKLVDEFADQIIDLLVEGIPFDKVCSSIGLCDSAVKSAKSQDNDADLSHLSDNVLCPVCQWAMTELKSLIVGPVTKDAVKAALNVLCDDAPFTLKPVCIKLVDEFADQVIDLLVEGIPFDKVCSSIGLCDSAVKNFIRNPSIEATGGKCAFCHLYMAKSARLLCNDKNQICDKVHSTLQQDCSAFEDAHRGRVTALLNKGVDPSLVCVRIGFCTRSGRDLSNPWFRKSQ